MCNRVYDFSFYPEGSNEGQKTTFFSVKFVTWTISTFSGIHNWYSRIWLGMSRKCALSIRNFHFAPWSHMGVEQWGFLPYQACHLNSNYISRVNKWHSGIWLVMSCSNKVLDCFQSLVIWTLCTFQEIVFVCLFGVYRPTQEFFTHMETSPFPVKDYKFWPMLGTHNNWAVKFLKRVTPTATRVYRL